MIFLVFGKVEEGVQFEAETNEVVNFFSCYVESRAIKK